MTEEQIVELVQDALRALGVDEEVVAAGEFSPRGHSGAAFVGGSAGGDAGRLLGGLGEAVGVAAGALAGQRMADAESGLPPYLVVGVTATHVYGFAGRRSHLTPGLVFQLARAGVRAHVHQRVNVRILELVDEATGSRLELEGNRLPVTHSKDVIDALAGD